MLSIAINRAEHVCATVIIKHNYKLMCNHKIVINIMLCLLNSTGHHDDTRNRSITKRKFVEIEEFSQEALARFKTEIANF